MIRRRHFLGLAAAALPAAGCRRRPSPVASCTSPAPPAEGPGKVLDAEQWSTLRAACARLMPSDGEPGAEEAGAAGFIDGQLAAPPLASLRAELTEGLREMQRLAREAGGSSFAALPPARQDAILQKLQRGVPLGRRRNSRHFFRVLLSLTLEGFLCDPVYGGNRDEVGWRFVGFRPRPPRPRCPYRSG